ncbi:MAG: DUF3786 domain-containing protein [Candidatus Bathyarchaeia archaeon]
MSKPKSLVHELWNWERRKEKIVSLRGRLGFPDEPFLKFLGLKLSLENGTIYDELRNQDFRGSEALIYCILYGYANAKVAPETHRLISFRQLKGGQAYFNTFTRRAIHPIEKTFGTKPQMLVETAKIFGGLQLKHGDFSVKIYALPLVPVIVILWAETTEFPATASVLFDASADKYLSTEELAGLAELTSQRLRHALEVVNKV